jgi:hypothetical protein
MPLHAQSVADFHAAIMAALSDVGIERSRACRVLTVC